MLPAGKFRALNGSIIQGGEAPKRPRVFHDPPAVPSSMQEADPNQPVQNQSSTELPEEGTDLTRSCKVRKTVEVCLRRSNCCNRSICASVSELG